MTTSPNEKPVVSKTPQESTFSSALDEDTVMQVKNEATYILTDLAADRSLELFRSEYLKMFQAFQKSHQGELRLAVKCRELNAELVAYSAKTKAVASLQDESTMEQLKREIENYWRLIDASSGKADKVTGEIAQVRGETKILRDQIETSSGMSAAQNNAILDLLKLELNLQKERDQKFEQVLKLRDELEEADNMQAAYKKEIHDKSLVVDKVKKETRFGKLDAETSRIKKAYHQDQCKSTETMLNYRIGDFKETYKEIEELKRVISRKEDHLVEMKVRNELRQKELDAVLEEFPPLERALQQKNAYCEELINDNKLKAAEVKVKDAEVIYYRTDIDRTEKIIKKVLGKNTELEEKKMDFEDKRSQIKTKINNCEADMRKIRLKADEDRREWEDLRLKRDKMNKSLLKAAETTQRQLNIVKLHDQSRQFLEQEVINNKEEAQKQRKIIYRLEKERDKFITEASDVTFVVIKQMDQIKQHEIQFFDKRKALAETETKLYQQENLYTAALNDRALFAKKSIEHQFELVILKDKLSLLRSQTLSLKKELNEIEDTLVSGFVIEKKLVESVEISKQELVKLKKDIAQTKVYFEVKEKERRRLVALLDSMEGTLGQLRMKIHSVFTDSDLLSSRMIKKNGELQTLYDKVKTQQVTLSHGEKIYIKTLRTIDTLHGERKTLTIENRVLQMHLTRAGALEKESLALQKDLLDDRLRCRILEDELKHPMNIHRWRKLKTSAPTYYAMKEKLHILQKQVIHRNDEYESKMFLIETKERQFFEYQLVVISRQPSPELAEQLQIYFQSLQDKKKQLKQLREELITFNCRSQDLSFKLKHLEAEMRDICKNYVRGKKREFKYSDNKVEAERMISKNLLRETRKSRKPIASRQ